MKLNCEAISIGLFSVIAFSLLTIAIHWGYPAHQDEIFFKSAGLHWAEGEGWKAPEEHNFGGWEPPLQEVFASYPPLYPFVFGLAVKCFGFSQTVSNAYDVTIHIVLALVLVLFAQRVLTHNRIIPWLIGILWLLCSYPSRPDRLAMLFGYLALVFVLNRNDRQRRVYDILAGLSMGGCLATSFPCTIAMASLMIGACLYRTVSFGQSVVRLLKIGLVSGLTGMACLLPVMMYHPGAIEQNLAATVSITNAIGFTEGLQRLLRFHLPTLLAISILVAMGLPLLILAGRNGTAWKRRDWLIWYGIPFVPLLFFFVKSTFQGGYHWFVIPWLAVALFIPEIQGRLKKLIRPTILLAAFLLSIAYAQRTTLSAIVTQGDQQVARFQDEVEALVPAGASVIARDYWWLLAKRNQVFDKMIAGDPDLMADYVVISGYASGGLGNPQSLPPNINADTYEVVLNSLGQTKPTFFGIPMSRSTFSAGPIVLERKGLSK